MKRPLLAALFIALTLAGYAALRGAQEAPAYPQGIKAVTLLKTTTTTLGQPIVYPKTDKPEVMALEMEIAPGKETGWHKHPVPGYAYILSGTLTVEMEGNKRFQFPAGKAFAEVVNVLHNGKNLGTEPVKLVAFFTGAVGQPYSIVEVKE